MKNLRILLIALTLLAFNAQYAQEQEQEELSLEKSPISGQFEYLEKKSGNYRADGKRYEVVRIIHLNQLRNNVLDTLNASKKQIASLKSTITGHESSINSLNSELKNTSEQLVSVTETKDNMSFFGAKISKGSYSFILWSVIGGLLLLLALFIYKFKNSNVLTVEAKNSLSELEDEFEQHRTRSLEREQRISRQLQDEINKLKKGK